MQAPNQVEIPIPSAAGTPLFYPLHRTRGPAPSVTLFSKPLTMRYALTDIHGCAQTLRAALDTVNYDPAADELFFLGDYIDRGPDSQGVIDTVRQLQAENPKVVALRGNHEEMLIEYDEDRRYLYDWQPDPEHYPSTLAWLKALPHYHLTPGYILVHAGLGFGGPNPLDDRHAMLWARYWYGDIDRGWLGKRIIVHGHTPAIKDRIAAAIEHMPKNQYACIDSACVYDKPGTGHLTVLNLDTGEGVFVRRVEEV